MIARIIRFLPFAALLLSLCSCTPKWTLVLINGLDRPINGRLIYFGSTQRVVIRLLPNERTMLLGALGQIFIQDATGEKETRDFIDIRDPNRIFWRKEGQKIVMYQLILDDGVYRVPIKYRSDWRSHLDEIKRLRDSVTLETELKRRGLL